MSKIRTEANSTLLHCKLICSSLTLSLRRPDSDAQVACSSFVPSDNLSKERAPSPASESVAGWFQRKGSRIPSRRPFQCSWTRGALREISRCWQRVLPKPRLEALRRRLVAVGAGCRRGDLGGLLRLDLRFGRGRVRRFGNRHTHRGSDVSRYLLFDCRNVAGAAAHGRCLLFRADGNGALGRIHHGAGRECGVHPHTGGDRCGHRRLHGIRVQRDFGIAIPAPGLVAALLCSFRGAEHRRGGGDFQVFRADHTLGIGHSGRVLGGRSTPFQLGDCAEHPTRQRQFAFSALRLDGCRPSPALRHLVLPCHRATPVGR